MLIYALWSDQQATVNSNDDDDHEINKWISEHSEF